MFGTVVARVEDRWRVHGLSLGRVVERSQGGRVLLYDELANGGHTCS